MDEFSYQIKSEGLVANNMATILFEEEFSDVVLICGAPGFFGSKIVAHRQILAASSDVLKSMLYGPFVEGSKREIKIPNIEPNIMRQLIEFIYTGQLKLTSANQIVPLIYAAD